MSVPDLKWRRILPGWYRAEIRSPAGLTMVNIERRTRFRTYVSEIVYPDGSTWGCDRESLRTARLTCEIVLICSSARLGWPETEQSDTISEARSPIDEPECQDRKGPDPDPEATAKRLQKLRLLEYLKSEMEAGNLRYVSDEKRRERGSY